MQMKLKTLGLTLLATAFMASAALAQSGTMQPIPNPPEKAKMKHKKMHHMAKKDAEPAAEKAEAKPAMPAKK
jgi:hypothetical protein